MLRVQHKSRSLNSALVPTVCEVCRSQPAEVVVVEFIFACDRCAEKIRAAPGEQRANAGNPFSSPGTETKPSIPSSKGLSPNGVESLLRRFPAKKRSSTIRNDPSSNALLICDRSVSYAI